MSEETKEFDVSTMMGPLMGIVMIIVMVSVVQGISRPTFDPWVYDIDGDCYISMSEAQAAVNDCFMGLITGAQRDQVVALWQSGTRNPACG